MTAPSRPDLKELLARVEKAEGADRELDEAILDATFRPMSGYPSWQQSASAFGWSPRVTRSLDAALALVERVLPGMSIRLESLPKPITSRHGWWACLGEQHSHLTSTPALALLAALLKALLAKENDRG